MFEGFQRFSHMRDGVKVQYLQARSGKPAILFLHGFPQTHAMWAKIAPQFLGDYDVICPDLRGYGASDKPRDVAQYSFAEMARDQIALMQSLGYDRYHVVGHDRGARVAHRLALLAPDAVATVTLMDIVPTHLLLATLSKEVAQAYYHWFFLAQPEPVPENMIAADPIAYFNSCLMGWGQAEDAGFDPQQLSAYRAAWQDRETIRGMCNDYRAALAHDFDDDAADLGRCLDMPACIMWGRDGIMGRQFDVPATWADRFAHITPIDMPGGHFFPDHVPDMVAHKLRGFLRA
jgi:haloacetate dehalogenase